MGVVMDERTVPIIGDAELTRLGTDRVRATVSKAFPLGFEVVKRGGVLRLEKFVLGGFNLTSVYNYPAEHNALNHSGLIKRVKEKMLRSEAVLYAEQKVAEARLTLTQAEGELEAAKVNERINTQTEA